MNDRIMRPGNDPILMGIVNVTPDSFSDGGRYLDPRRAIDHGLKLVAEGAEILDIGGESTRPGAAPVSVQEEQDRVMPVLEGLKDCGAILSVDTRNSTVIKNALTHGAGMINDISALTHDPESLPVIAKSECLVCLMHMQGDPRTMQDRPVYQDVFQEVYDYLAGRIEICEKAGMNRSRIMIDPGIGFGKTLEHNLILLSRLGNFGALNTPVLLGASRKRFIESLCPGTQAEERLPGSIAAALAAYGQGVRHFRVHDVAATKQALTIYRSISGQHR